MQIQFTGEVIDIKKGNDPINYPNGLGIVFQLDSGTGITIQVPKANESDFKVGSTYTFVGTPNK